MDIDISAKKKELRRKLKDIRASITFDEKKKAGDNLCDLLTQSELYLSSKYILCFASYGSEIPTWSFINKALSDGKEVYLPKVISSKLVFYRMHDMLDLVPGYKGVLEPDGATQCFIPENSCSEAMLIIPGLGFDEQNNRIGYGGGYYDRFLQENELLSDRNIAIGYKCQFVDSIPVAAHDIKPNSVLLI